MSDNIRRNNLAETIIEWSPVGVFEGIAKDSSAVSTSFREDGGDLEMAGDGIFGTLHTDNDYSAVATIKLDESSPTYAALMNVYLAGKGTNAVLNITYSSGENETIECAFIKDIGEVTTGFRASNFREVMFVGSRRNFDGRVI